MSGTVDTFTDYIAGQTYRNTSSDLMWTLEVSGALGGGALIVEVSLNDTTWVAVPDVTLSAAGSLNFKIITPYIRTSLTGSGGSPSCTARLTRWEQ